MNAAEPGDFETLRFLISDGKEEEAKKLLETKDFSEEVHKKCMTTFSPIYEAVSNGQLKMVRLLLKHGLGYHREGDTNPLILAVNRHHLEIVRALVGEFGYDVNMADRFGFSPLMTATQGMYNMELVKYLVESGADVNHYTNYGTVLHMCVSTGNHSGELCRYILSNGFNQIDACDSNGNTVLNKAVWFNSKDIVDVLLQHGVDFNIANGDGITPFWNGLYLPKTDILTRLMAYGCKPDVAANGTRPMDYSIDNEKYEIVHFLAVTLNLPIRGGGLRPETEDNMICRVAGTGRITYENLSTIFLLLKVGYQPSDEEYKALSYMAVALLTGYPARFINEYLYSPRSLVDTCCVNIRRVLGPDLPQVVDRLPLPQKLINFVKLTHVKPNDEFLVLQRFDFVSDTNSDVSSYDDIFDIFDFNSDDS